jgi:hypothetical protein
MNNRYKRRKSPLVGPHRAEIVAGAERLLRAIDPRVDQAVYLLDFEEVEALGVPIRQDSAQSCVKTNAFVYPGLIVELESQLRAAGRWRGDGFLAAFDFAAFPSPMQFVGCALHEFAHAVADAALAARCIDGLGGRKRAAAILKQGRNSDGVLDITAAQPIDKHRRGQRHWHHNSRWIRLLAHCEYRAYKLGDWLGQIWDCSPTVYGLSSATIYAAYLADEPEQMLGATLAEVRDTPPPDRFVEFAARDLAEADARDAEHAERAAASIKADEDHAIAAAASEVER